METSKILECSCLRGFTGDFCEFKTEEDHLLFVSRADEYSDILPYEFIFNADGRLIQENSVDDELSAVVETCSTMFNGEAVIFGGEWEPSGTNGYSWRTTISVVFECRLKHLGDLPGGFAFTSSGTFMIKGLPTILGCDGYGCNSFIRRNNDALSDINDFDFDSEFEIDTVVIPEFSHYHEYARIANYQGFPLILGGYENNKLEMLNTLENQPIWVEYEDYPYSNM